MDLTIEFDENFIPSVSSSASEIFAGEGERVEDGTDDEDMTTGEVEVALLETEEEDYHDSQVSC